MVSPASRDPGPFRQKSAARQAAQLLRRTVRIDMLGTGPRARLPDHTDDPGCADALQRRQFPGRYPGLLEGKLRGHFQAAHLPPQRSQAGAVHVLHAGERQKRSARICGHGTGHEACARGTGRQFALRERRLLLGSVRRAHCLAWPGLFTPGKTFLCHRNNNANQFDIRIEICHPLFGTTFTQAGVFREMAA